MNVSSRNDAAGKRTPYWIAIGFVGAFAASVATVIYTGLMVEGSRAEFDADFRSVTMAVGERRVIELAFDVPRPAAGAMLAVQLPPMLEPADSPGSAVIEREVDLVAGDNSIAIEVHAIAAASAYLVARLSADEPLALERVFVTVTDD